MCNLNNTIEISLKLGRNYFTGKLNLFFSIHTDKFWKNSLPYPKTNPNRKSINCSIIYKSEKLCYNQKKYDNVAINETANGP